MAERSFKKEVQQLKIGAGEEFRGEGILAITKALLESGVGYVGGYQTFWPMPRKSWGNLAFAMRPMRQKPPPLRCWQPPSIIPFGAQLPLNPPSALMSHPTLWPIWHQVE